VIIKDQSTSPNQVPTVGRIRNEGVLDPSIIGRNDSSERNPIAAFPKNSDFGIDRFVM